MSVEHADPRNVHRQITRNVLTSGRPSDRSLHVLERFGLRERFEEEPAETLALLHAGLAPTGDQRRLFALAELSFAHADRSRDARYYAAAAIYAYALLFPETGEELLDASDPRVRVAFELYNRGITEALSRDASGEIQLRKGTFPLPFGSIEIDAADSEFDWGGHRLTGFVAAADLEIHGLRNRYRRSGMGAPYVRRVIFICTPHQGSYLASVSAARLVSDLISLPSNLTVVLSELVLQNPDDMLMRGVARLPTSIDNMTPGNPFIQVLSILPIAPGIHAHSIIAVQGDGPLESKTDGVVRFKSAHLADVESELVVHAGHSAQGRPAVTEEVNRILREHAAQIPLLAGGKP